MLTREKMLELLEQSGAEFEQNSVTFDSSFQAIGLDSLDVFNLFSEVETEVGISIPDEDFEKIKTLNELREYADKRSD